MITSVRGYPLQFEAQQSNSLPVIFDHPHSWFGDPYVSTQHSQPPTKSLHAVSGRVWCASHIYTGMSFITTAQPSSKVVHIVDHNSCAFLDLFHRFKQLPVSLTDQWTEILVSPVYCLLNNCISSLLDLTRSIIMINTANGENNWQVTGRTTGNT